MMTLYFPSSFPGQFSIMATSMRSAFGASHFRANFGLLFTITVANNCVLLLCSQVCLPFYYCPILPPLTCLCFSCPLTVVSNNRFNK